MTTRAAAAIAAAAGDAVLALEQVMRERDAAAKSMNEAVSQQEAHWLTENARLRDQLQAVTREHDRLQAKVLEQNEQLFFARQTRTQLERSEANREELARALSKKAHALGVEQEWASTLATTLERLVGELPRTKASRSPRLLDARGSAVVLLEKWAARNVPCPICGEPPPSQGTHTCRSGGAR